NGYQVLSWILWISLFWIGGTYRGKRFMAPEKYMAIMGLASALFLVILGIFYFIRAQAIKGYSKVFSEYSSLLLLIGSVFLIYSMLITYLRFFRKDKT
ncbi:MAG TPA: hypothetical protein VLZ54_10670, partial [Arenibacter sp.]|nr:hypothetical protein [Arenibacter sp.]